jgi:hypothetical protein
MFAGRIRISKETSGAACLRCHRDSRLEERKQTMGKFSQDNSQAGQKSNRALPKCRFADLHIHKWCSVSNVGRTGAGVEHCLCNMEIYIGH